VTEDDLTPWQDSPLVKAMTTDGTDGELSGENAALAAFQASTHGRRGRGLVRLISTGATSVALVGLVGGGVAAAAYTRSLPKPVQTVMHEVLGPIGVPAPEPHKPSNPPNGSSGASAGDPVIPATSTATPVPTRSESPSTQSSPSARPSASAAKPAGGLPVGSASPTVSPSPTPSESPTATPTPTPTPIPTPTGPVGDPSTWSISSAASSQLVRVHQNVRITGTLYDASGQPVPDQRVVIRVRHAGTAGWQRAAVRRTDSDGSVRARLDDLMQNTVVVLGAGHGVHSSPLQIVVRPVLSASSTPSTDGTSYVVTVTADGGQPGDIVDLMKHTASGWERVGEAQLDGSASASFSVPAPKRQHGYVLRLPATDVHGAAATRIVLQPLS